MRIMKEKAVRVIAAALLVTMLATVGCGGGGAANETESDTLSQATATDTTPETVPDRIPESDTEGATSPETDAPATEAPGTDAPATEAPETDAPATEAPETDAPATEAPATEAPETAPETETETETEAAGKEPIDMDQLSDLDKETVPFWKTDTMYNESTTFIVRDDGSITAKLYFRPTAILSVKSNDLKTTYTEGVDYVWDGESNTLTLPAGSAIPYFTQNDIHGKDENGNYIEAFPTWDDQGRSRFGDALYCVGAFLYEKQIAVTYTYEFGSWDGPVTTLQTDRLPKTMAKIAALQEAGDDEQALNVVFYGDSIFTGCDSSKMYNREPFQCSFPDYIKLVMEEKYGIRVKRYNPSVGGMDSTWGVENTAQVTQRAPDLVFIGFGMNDGGKKGRVVAKNIEKIMENIRAEYPDCEFVVVAPMVPNAEAGFLSTHGQFSHAYEVLAGEGVAYVDMFRFHDKLLKQKDFISMSGNNVNHPNDWLIRVYTMNLLSVFFPYE